jgi:sterol desaturase/sphingolipid hydroxylase (fatty acid hydroxylase superfamily)
MAASNNTGQLRKKRYQTSAAFLALLVVSFASYIGSVYLLSQLVKHWPALSPFVFVDTHGNAAFSLWGAALQPGALLAVLGLCLAFEASSIGLEKSAINRLVSGASASTRVDWFYIILRLTGGINLLAFVFSFGTLFWLANQIHRVLHIAILHHVHSFIIQFAIVYLMNTFVAYWGHRFMHTRMMWEIHKVHHAADEMNLVTCIRNHPIDSIVNGLLNAFSVALLGASPAVVISYYGLNMAYQLLVHSEINLKGKFWDEIWITPAAHRVHHSNRVEHFDTNFGILAFWDRLFGTYHAPTNEKLAYGVSDGAEFNRPQYLAEVFANVLRWLRPMWMGHSVANSIHSETSSSLVAAPSAEQVGTHASRTIKGVKSGNAANLTPA